ncbi:Protein of unknown function [Saccharopolyspora kobensis]|uniref:DUF2000 domain-containing protein n=1 Tax=Saccharopolyspora kobensis TaxID=146035 RepID=A0A1H6C620_9PSEU|nr:DUF2000 domain-containing protein [Saccharopolyspora kobensis]SEG68085.1 Protein of unknown function [Saccharopolyspora kobensis]SFC28634.1 Protein of unknown function [Saccharopolyspora kobensis]
MSLPTKLVLVVRSDLEANAAVNAAVVVGLSMGARLPHLLAADGEDASGGVHAGLNPNPVPVLVADADQLRNLHDRAQQRDELTVVGFNEVARRARDYDDYLSALSEVRGSEVDQVAVAVFGPRNRVTALTKRFPLLGSELSGAA